MAKTKADKKLYTRLRDSGIRKRVAKRVAEAIPAKGQKKPTKAHRVADELTAAANSIRDRAGGGSRTGGGSRKRSKAAKKAARTRKANVPKRRNSAKKGARNRAKA
jgi:hypothetical protein